MNQIKTTATMVEKMRKLAKALVPVSSNPLSLCLEVVARQNGYESWKHVTMCVAQHRPLASPPSSPTRTYSAWVSVSWFKSRRDCGVETLPVLLRKPLAQLLDADLQLQTHRFSVLRQLSHDRLASVNERVLSDRGLARDEAGRAVRLLQFIDATGLRRDHVPLEELPGVDPYGAIPSLDHATVWVDDCSGRRLLVSEPYEGRVAGLRADLERWCADHHYDLATPSWSGMYSSAGTVLHLLSHRELGIPLPPVADALKGMSSQSSGSDWTGHSVAGSTTPVVIDTFASAVAQSLTDPRPSLTGAQARAAMSMSRSRLIAQVQG